MGVTSRQDGADLCEVQCVDPEKVARAARTMLSVETVTQAAETLRALGDPTRLRIVRALMTEELCVCDLATLVGHTQPTVSPAGRRPSIRSPSTTPAGVSAISRLYADPVPSVALM